MRINKYLAALGICSRREADKLIEEGKIFINKKRAKLGDQVSEKDSIVVNGKPVMHKMPEKVYMAFNKPYSVISTTDKMSANKIMDYIKVPFRVYPVGRLDVRSSGLIILTNDGELVNMLLKSKNNKEKEYIVKVNKPLTDEVLKKFERGGIYMDRKKTLPAKINKINDTEFSITIVQGIKRQIRRMCENMGYEVKSLIRVRIAGVLLGDLPRGKWRYLSEEEVESLKNKNENI